MQCSSFESFNADEINLVGTIYGNFFKKKKIFPLRNKHNQKCLDKR